MTRISLKRTVAVAVTVLALTAMAAPTASAEQGSASSQPTQAAGRFVPTGPDAGLYCGKDYSQNSATGDYCVRLKATCSSPAPVAAKQDGFSWGDARAGAGAVLALVLAAAGGIAVLRRRRAASATRVHGSPATT